MRGSANQQLVMVVTKTPEDMVPQDHPIRRIKAVVEDALGEMSPVFQDMYSRLGRGSVPPEQLLKASVLMMLYSIRSERQFCEQLRYNLLFKWFLNPNAEEVSGRGKSLHSSYAASQRSRKRVEEVFGWLKTIAGCRKLRYIGLARNRIWVLLSAATYNVLRISKLDAYAASR